MPDARGGIAGAIRKKNDVSRHVRPRRATSFIRANVSKIFLRRIPRILLGNLALQPEIISSRRRHCACLPPVTSGVGVRFDHKRTTGYPWCASPQTWQISFEASAGPRRERNSALREGLICVMQLTRPSSNLTNWPAMSDRIHPVLFFILRGLNR